VKATVQNLLDFVNSRAASPGPEVAGALAAIGKLRLRLVAIKLLSWLKLQRRVRKVLPLGMDDRHEWCRDLLDLVQRQALLNGVIAIESGAVVLSSGLRQDEREELLALVDAEYQPPLRTRPPNAAHKQ
jgi:hypothetical protein